MIRQNLSEATAAVPDPVPLGGRPRADSLVESYRRLAEVFHHVLSEQDLDSLLDRIADTLADLVPYDTLTVYRADEAQRELLPVLSRRDRWETEVLSQRISFGQGITGWAVEHAQPVLTNRPHLDPRVSIVTGTPPNEPEALISVPLIARGTLKGALNIYRLGDSAAFADEEFELAKWFGDAAALALDNAEIRARLEHQAQTDSLTGLYNHRSFHERLRSELARANRAHDSVALLMLDIDDFKRVNDIYGHGAGDHILVALAEVLEATVRSSDVACRLGGEEFAVILPSCDASDGLGLARRLAVRLAEEEFEPAGRITLSMGIAEGPRHATNPRELAACAESAMMAAKARGKAHVLLFDDRNAERPESPASNARDVRSVAHLKMLQSLSGKLNRLNDVEQIGAAITDELRMLIDYHNCRVYLVEGEQLVPIAFRGDGCEDCEAVLHSPHCGVGEGVTGRAAETGESVLVPDVLACGFARHLPGTTRAEESLVAVPFCYGSRVIGVVVISKLGLGQFDEDDVRLLEVLAGHAAVALENARLYEAQRREAENARRLLEFSDAISEEPSFEAIGEETVRTVSRLMEAPQCSLWLEDARAEEFSCVAHVGYAGHADTEAIARLRHPRDEAERFMEGRKLPFLQRPEDTRRAFPAASPGLAFVTVAVSPLLHDERVKGWITVRDPGGDGSHFTDDRLRLVGELSYRASVALQKARLYRAQQESAEAANALLEFGRELATADGLGEVLSRIVETSARILGSPRTSVWLQNGETGEVLLRAAFGYDAAQREQMLGLRFGAEIASPALEAAEPFVLGPEDVEELGGPTIAGPVRLAIAPLTIDRRRLGCIVAAAPAPGDYEFPEVKLRLLAGLADQAKLAIANAE